MGKKDKNEALIDSSIKRRFRLNYGTKCGEPKSDQMPKLYDQDKPDRTIDSSIERRFRLNYGTKCGEPKSDQMPKLYDQDKPDRTWSPQIKNKNLMFRLRKKRNVSLYYRF